MKGAWEWMQFLPPSAFLPQVTDGVDWEKQKFLQNRHVAQ